MAYPGLDLQLLVDYARDVMDKPLEFPGNAFRKVTPVLRLDRNVQCET